MNKNNVMCFHIIKDNILKKTSKYFTIISNIRPYNNVVVNCYT